MLCKSVMIYNQVINKVMSKCQTQKKKDWNWMTKGGEINDKGGEIASAEKSNNVNNGLIQQQLAMGKH